MFPENPSLIKAITFDYENTSYVLTEENLKKFMNHFTTMMSLAARDGYFLTNDFVWKKKENNVNENNNI